MASGGDGELPSREEAAAAMTTAAMEVDNSSVVTPTQERVVGEGLATVVEAGGGTEVAMRASGGVAAVGDLGDSEAARGGHGGLATSSRDTSGKGGNGTSSGGGATGTPHTPTVEDLLAVAERAGDERREGGGDEVVTASWSRRRDPGTEGDDCGVEGRRQRDWSFALGSIHGGRLLEFREAAGHSNLLSLHRH
ncbi:hypothetical protein RHMOL_Rhmol11G0019300 [Rhododendron molle]|uniref:Uncharacterized protein n=1 Tax=Rhododendron molle TaxID=49168 RepID=A0ACC0LNU3_RHOML|nr:hypothetical protein RHMOL_Rhmol11G0019300 [Rhododendron molle]